MNSFLSFNARIISTFLVILLTTACTPKEPVVKYQLSQAEFMNIVSEHRYQYFSEYEKEFYLDKDQTLKSILMKRNDALNNVIKNNDTIEWKGNISRMFLTSENEAWLELVLADDSKLATNDNTVIQPDTDLFQELRNYQVGSEIYFSGKFVRPSEEWGKHRNEKYFSEKSFTEKGSMEEPEFYFEFTSFH